MTDNKNDGADFKSVVRYFSPKLIQAYASVGGFGKRQITELFFTDEILID